jgi:hypothetical protein
MIWRFDDIDGAGKPAAKQINNLADWTYFYVQVQGGNTLRLAATSRELMNPPPGAAPFNGLQITAVDGIVPLRWKGELWGIGSAPGTIADFQFPGGIK